MIGNVIEYAVLPRRDYPTAAALSFIADGGRSWCSSSSTSAAPGPRSSSDGHAPSTTRAGPRRRPADGRADGRAAALGSAAPLTWSHARVPRAGLPVPADRRRHRLLVQRRRSVVRTYAWQGFSTEAWTNICGDPSICASLVNAAFKIGLVATVVATILGTLIAFALVRHRFRGRSGHQPDDLPADGHARGRHGVLAAALFLNLRSRWASDRSSSRTSCSCISFVVVTVKARVAGLDPRLEQAAMDLYANERRRSATSRSRWWHPASPPAALLAFSLSFDDFIITNFNSGHSSARSRCTCGAPPQRGVPAAGQRDRFGDVLRSPWRWSWWRQVGADRPAR